ncbi:MAG TPA: creatininase family protein [Chthonomonadaceae bacterium]|nr:creatininase family protein [Chthonomonadaceae bacterium]
MESLDKILYDELTWPEINVAVTARKVLLLPIGSTEQHGHHLPLDVDNFLARGICLAAARLAPLEMLVMPTIPYGYNEHALDFPGTIHVTYEHFIEFCLDVCKSAAYAGFERIVLVDGHGSNEHLCEFIARRATLETDAIIASVMWTSLAVESFEQVRESGHGGAAHACELETSAYLYLDPSRVKMELAQDHYGGAAGVDGSKFLHVDLTRGWGPVKVVRWTSSATPTGVSGAPSLATAEKGAAIVQGAAENLVAFVREFKAMEKGERVDHRAVKPAMPKLPNLD